MLHDSALYKSTIDVDIVQYVIYFAVQQEVG